MNTGFFANSAKFSSQAVGAPERRFPLRKIDTFQKGKKRPGKGKKMFPRLRRARELIVCTGVN